MSPEAQRIAIAEACGWQQDGPWGNHWVAPDGQQHSIWGAGLACPDFLNDLNAMHTAVVSLGEPQRHAYAILLSGGLWLPEHTRGWQDWRDTLAVSEATAAQRAEAFLRALNLWTP